MFSNLFSLYSFFLFQDSIPITRDITLYPLVMRNVSLFPSQVDSRIVPGSTVLIDFLYFIHPVSQQHNSQERKIIISHIAVFFFLS